MEERPQHQQYSNEESSYNQNKNAPDSSNYNSDSNSFGHLKTLALVLISALIGAFSVIAVLPYLFGSTPFEFYGNRGKGGIGSSATTSSIKTIIENNKTPNYAVAVSKKVQPWVVNISTQERDTHLSESPREIEGVGSGIIFRKDGYILTNNHVVEEAKQITVTLPDNKEVSGKVVGQDRDSDLAVIKIKADNLRIAELGSSAKLQVGEPVLAIGSPFGLEHTITAGIISALHRNVTTHSSRRNSTTLIDLIQTDAAINPGNSGGALVNTEGQLIGINTLIFSETGSSGGIGFAVPVDLAKRSANQIIEKGSVSHPFMGIVGTDFPSSGAPKKNLPYKKGAVITEVSPNTPAAKAGLRKNDVIVGFGGKSVENMEDLIAKIRQKKVGDKVAITFFREKKKHKVTLTLVKKPKRFM